MSKPVRIGFVGCGNHAVENLYPAMRNADCTLVAACDLYENRRTIVQNAYRPARMYDRYEPVLESDDLDAVIVCGPPALHHAAGIAALKRKLPVLMEKPPAPSYRQTAEIRDAASTSGTFAMVAFMKRFAQKYALAKAIASRPEFGRLTHAHLKYSYRVELSPGDTLRSMGIHALDLLRHFMGDVSSMTAQLQTIGKTNSFSILLGFANGGTGTLVMNAASPAVTERLELTGSGESVIVDEVATLWHARTGEGVWSPPVQTLYAPNFPLQVSANNSGVLQGYAGEVQAFVEAVESGKPPAIATIDDAVEAMRLCELIEKTGSGTVDMESVR